MKKNRPNRRARYWHGLGACPDPRTVRRIETAEIRGLPVRPNAPLECREYVYASTSWEVALAFSTLGGGQAVCEIKPETLAAEVDQDFPTLGVRFHGPVKSLSVEIVSDSALPNARQIIKTLAADYRWTDRTPQYSEDGYLRTPPISRARGFVDEDSRWLGRWVCGGFNSGSRRVIPRWRQPSCRGSGELDEVPAPIVNPTLANTGIESTPWRT